MNVTIAERGDLKFINVTLSKRNLEQLLAALELFEERGGTHAPYLVRNCSSTEALTVVAQTNDEHYERREPGPGFDGIV